MMMLTILLMTMLVSWTRYRKIMSFIGSRQPLTSVLCNRILSGF